MFPWHFSKVNLKVEEAIITSLEKILDIPILLDKLFEARDGLVDLIFVQINKINSFFFLLDEILGDLILVFVEGQPFLEWFLLLNFLNFHFLLLLDRLLLLLNFLYIFAHDC